MVKGTSFSCSLSSSACCATRSTAHPRRRHAEERGRTEIAGRKRRGEACVVRQNVVVSGNAGEHSMRTACAQQSTRSFAIAVAIAIAIA
eukprot:484241-Rhodomonas_salina.1